MFTFASGGDATRKLGCTLQPQDLERVAPPSSKRELDGFIGATPLSFITRNDEGKECNFANPGCQQRCSVLWRGRSRASLEAQLGHDGRVRDRRNTAGAQGGTLRSCMLRRVFTSAVLRRSRHGSRGPACAGYGRTPGRTDKVPRARSDGINKKPRRAHARPVSAGRPGGLVTRRL